MNRNKYIFCILSFLQGLVFYGAYPVVYRMAHGLGMREIFVLESLYLGLMLALEVPWGMLSDRIGYRRTLIISFFLFALSKLAFYKAYGFTGFFVETLLGALAGAGLSGCDSALLYQSIHPEESEKVFGRMAAFGSAGLLISSLTGSALVDHSLDLLAFLTVISYGLAFVLSFFLVDSKKSKEEKADLRGILKSILEDQKILWLLVSLAILSECTHDICVFLNQPLYQRSGIELKWFGVLTAVMQIATMASCGSAFFVKRVGKNKVLLCVLCSMAVICGLLIFNRLAWLTVLLVFAMEAVFALSGPISETMQNESITVCNRATVLSVYAMIMEVVAMGINALVAWASGYSLSWSVGVCFLLSLVSIVFLGMYIKNKSTGMVK